MKKILLILTLLLPFIGGCKKDKEVKNPLKKQIVGQWTLHTPARGAMDRPTQQQYTFDDEGNFQYYRIALEATTNNMLGYQFKRSGKYKIEGNEIVLYDITTYSNDFSKAEYSAESQLIKTSGETSRAGIDISNNVLKLDFPCPPYATCIGVFFYQRQ
jgi:hypothetical protein